MLMSSPDRPATLLFGPNGFRIVTAGNHVKCAVTGEVIPLETLRYWCVERQEAYASAAIVTRRLVDGA